VRIHRQDPVPPRNRLYDEAPGYYEAGGLWLYGNVRLLHGSLRHVPGALGVAPSSPEYLDDLAMTAERFTLDGKILVCGIHSEAHQRVALVPLRWGAPRIVVFSGGFNHHLGPDLSQEPFRQARLWRYGWDAITDLAVSRRAPEKLPTYATHNPTVDRMIELLATEQWPGLSSPHDTLSRPLSQW
jgi:hypothetical protein